MFIVIFPCLCFSASFACLFYTMGEFIDEDMTLDRFDVYPVDDGSDQVMEVIHFQACFGVACSQPQYYYACNWYGADNSAKCALLGGEIRCDRCRDVEMVDGDVVNERVAVLRDHVEPGPVRPDGGIGASGV